MHLIFFDKVQGYATVILENGKIKYSAQKDSLGFAEIEGTVQNDFFSDYMERSREISQKAQSVSKDMQAADSATREALTDEMNELQEEYKNFEVNYIKDNPSALISVLLMDRAIASRQMSYDELQGMYDGFTPEIKKTNAAKRISKQLEQLKEREANSKSTDIGAKAPEFTAPSPMVVK